MDTERAHRVQFTGPAAGFAWLWLLTLLRTLATLGLSLRTARQRRRDWFLAHTRVAGRPLDLATRRLLARDGRAPVPLQDTPRHADVPRLWLETLGVFAACVLAAGLLLAAHAGTWNTLLRGGPHVTPGAAVLAMLVVGGAVLAGIVVAALVALAYRHARLFQLAWGTARLGDAARFSCRLRTWRFVALRLVTALLTLATLGLARPFAMVAEHAMKARSLRLHVADPAALQHLQ